MKFLLFILFPGILFAQQKQSFDILDYDIAIEVSDSSDNIIGRNSIEIKFFSIDDSPITLDLVQLDTLGKGMLVSNIIQEGKAINFKHENNKLIIDVTKPLSEATSTIEVYYSGVPADGLIISENKFGNRTFFGDNWPNRASHWFPCIDHPSEKATVSFAITHPDEYTCVSNGELQSTTPLKSGKTLTKYSSKYSLPTKVMVFGLATLVSDKMKHPDNLEHVNFVFPENDIAGFIDMSVAPDPLDFFESHIASYPFEKLYNVQSTTRYGGMENAGCIFYDENAITGDGQMENLIAHEIAHQWFGNSATEADWSHLWLSEGFATYMTNLHIEHKYGRDKMNEQLIKDRNRVIRFHQVVQIPLKDTISTDPRRMLNPNAYQRGSWTLHMLRNKMGDEAFWNGIRLYYSEYKYSNATTADLKLCMQNETKIDLAPFFKQWTEKSGHPIISSRLTQRAGKQFLTIEQNQDQIFDFEIEVALIGKNGQTENTMVFITKKTHVIELKNDFKIESIKLDPNINLLFEETK